MTPSLTSTIAQQWLDAWNQHDLDAILAHYAEEIQFTSPFIGKLLGGSSDTLYGKAALRDYFARGLAAYPDLQFQPLQTLIGVDSLVIYYRSVNDLLAAEYMEINADGLVSRVSAHYGSEAS